MCFSIFDKIYFRFYNIYGLFSHFFYIFRCSKYI